MQVDDLAGTTVEDPGFPDHEVLTSISRLSSYKPSPPASISPYLFALHVPTLSLSCKSSPPFSGFFSYVPHLVSHPIPVRQMVPLSSLDSLSLSPNVSIFSPIRKMVPLPSQDLSPLSLDVPSSFPVSLIVPQDYSSSPISDKVVSSLSLSLAPGSPPDMASMLCPASHPISSQIERCSTYAMSKTTTNDLDSIQVNPSSSINSFFMSLFDSTARAHSVKKMPTELVKTLSQNASIVGRYIGKHQVFTPTILVIL